jgi:hypothetical protein
VNDIITVSSDKLRGALRLDCVKDKAGFHSYPMRRPQYTFISTRIDIYRIPRRWCLFERAILSFRIGNLHACRSFGGGIPLPDLLAPNINFPAAVRLSDHCPAPLLCSFCVVVPHSDGLRIRRLAPIRGSGEAGWPTAGRPVHECVIARSSEHTSRLLRKSLCRRVIW